MSNAINDNLILICGPAAAGKSASLMNLRDPEGVMYLNCESGKKLPFPNKFRKYTITDPYEIYEAFGAAESNPVIHTIVIDSLTYMMDMFESVHVLTSQNTMNAWSAFQQFFKNLMQQHVAKSSKNVIFTAHTQHLLNENDMVMETKVPVKGALKNNGIESYFSTVLAAKRMPVKKLKDFDNAMLTITEDNEIDGFKYVFQTKLTKDTINERIRAPIGMFKRNETYIDNDVQVVLDHFKTYYEE